MRGNGRELDGQQTLSHTPHGERTLRLRCQAAPARLRCAARVDTIAAMLVTAGSAPLVGSTASVVRMRIIASLLLFLMCLIAVWSSSHSDASARSDATSPALTLESGHSGQAVLDEPTGDVVVSLAQALPAAAVALCLVGVCVAGMVLERRFRLMRVQLSAIRLPRRARPQIVCTARPRSQTRSLIELSLSRT